jgi:hypothetical protein
METPAAEVTSLLHAWASGDRSVEPRLFEMVLPDLHKLAEQLMCREAPDNSVQPTVTKLTAGWWGRANAIGRTGAISLLLPPEPCDAS